MASLLLNNVGSTCKTQGLVLLMNTVAMLGGVGLLECLQRYACVQQIARHLYINLEH